MTQLPASDDTLRRRKNTRRLIAGIAILILIALLLWFLLMRKPPAPPPLAEFGAPLVVTDMELCPGLQLITAISQPDGDYESIKTIEAIDDEGIHIRYSSEGRVGDVFSDDYGKMQLMTVTRTVRKEDLQSGQYYAQRWFEDMPQVIPQATAIGASQRILSELKSAGKSAIWISKAYSGDTPVDREYRPNVYDFMAEGALTRTASDTFIVLVDDRLASLPTISARAEFINEAAEFTFLDDPRNPLTLSFRIGLTGRPDDKPETLTLTKIARTCGGAVAEGGPELDMAKQLGSARRIALYDVHFAFNSGDLRDESGPRLQEIAAMMSANPSWKIRVESHMDNTVDSPTATTLTESRAQAIKARLVSQYGVAENRIEVAGLGSEFPRSPNTTAEGRARNRRIEIALL